MLEQERRVGESDSESHALGPTPTPSAARYPPRSHLKAVVPASDQVLDVAHNRQSVNDETHH
jgi:hypothetical protein